VQHLRMQVFFTHVLEAVERYGGTLQRMLDDGVVVLFGAPLVQEDHAQRAVRAALGLLQGLGQLCMDTARLAEALGMRALQAHCRWGLGTLYAKIGRPEQVRSELLAEIDVYRAIDMTLRLPQMEAALA
jgi:class 3 adenylate cyclase